MSDPQQSSAQQELSPEAQAIMARARRTFMVVMGLLVVGFIIIGGALVYRASQSGSGNAGSAYALASLKIPQGGEVISAVAADGQVTVTYRAGPLISIRVFDGRTGDLVREIPVVPE